MADNNIWATINGHPWKFERRTQPIELVIMHSTRSGRPNSERDYESAMNWFTSPHNIHDGDWASMASRIIGHHGEHCIVMPDDYYPTWSAGHMDPIAVSFELAQCRDGVPYSEACLARAAREVGNVLRQHKVPVRMLAFCSGDNHEAPGISRHDRSANGVKWGKSDPGYKFDEQNFIHRIDEYLHGGEALASREYDELNRRLRELETSTVDKLQQAAIDADLTRDKVQQAGLDKLRQDVDALMAAKGTG